MQSRQQMVRALYLLGLRKIVHHLGENLSRVAAQAWRYSLGVMPCHGAWVRYRIAFSSQG